MKAFEKATFRPFHLPEIFPEIGRGRRLKKADHVAGSVPYASSSAMNNGIDGFIQAPKSSRVFEDCISLANSGSVGSAFYEPFKFVASDHVTHLKRPGTSRSQYLYLACMLKTQASNFSFSREITDARVSAMRIMLPVAENGSPDWEFMDACVKSVEKRLLARWKCHATERLARLEEREVPRLEEKAWKAFVIGDLFTVVAGEGLEKWNMVPGERPFIGASCFSNGVTDFVGNVNGSLDRLVLGVNADGSVGESFVHPYECLFSNHVSRLHLKNGRDSEAVLLFCAQAIRKQKEKYSFGYAFKAARMRRQEIMLPVDGAGEPDWDYMEQYVKNMMAKKLRQYLSFLEARKPAEGKPDAPAGDGGSRAA